MPQRIQLPEFGATIEVDDGLTEAEIDALVNTEVIPALEAERKPAPAPPAPESSFYPTGFGYVPKTAGEFAQLTSRKNIEEPLAPIPRWEETPGQGVATSGLKALVNVAGGAVSAMSSMKNIMALGTGGAYRAIPALYFGVDMARGVPEAARSAGQASVSGTQQEQAEAYLGLGANILFPAALARGVVRDVGKDIAASPAYQQYKFNQNLQQWQQNNPNLNVQMPLPPAMGQIGRVMPVPSQVGIQPIFRTPPQPPSPPPAPPSAPLPPAPSGPPATVPPSPPTAGPAGLGVPPPPPTPPTPPPAVRPPVVPTVRPQPKGGEKRAKEIRQEEVQVTKPSPATVPTAEAAQTPPPAALIKKGDTPDPLSKQGVDDAFEARRNKTRRTDFVRKYYSTELRFDRPEGADYWVESVTWLPDEFAGEGAFSVIVANERGGKVQLTDMRATWEETEGNPQYAAADKLLTHAAVDLADAAPGPFRTHLWDFIESLAKGTAQDRRAFKLASPGVRIADLTKAAKAQQPAKPTEVPSATETGKIKQGGQPERAGTAAGGIPAETGGGDRPASSGTQPARPTQGEVVLKPEEPAVTVTSTKVRGISRRELFRRESKLAGADDILDFIADEMPLLSKTGAKTKWSGDKFRANASLWDDAPRLARPHHNLIYRETGSAPDLVAQAAFERGLIPEPTTQALWNSVNKASRSRATVFERAREETVKIGQGADLETAISEKKTTNAPVNTSELKVGDKFEVEGEEFVVRSIDPDTGAVVIDDGRKFGRQTLMDGREIYVENYDPKEPSSEWGVEPEPSSAPKPEVPEEPAKPAPTTAPEVARLRQGQEQGDIFTGVQEDFTLVGEKGTDYARLAAERAELDRRQEEARRIEAERQTTMFQEPAAVAPQTPPGAPAPGPAPAAAPPSATPPAGSPQAQGGAQIITSLESWADKVIKDTLGGTSANPFADPRFMAAAAIKGAGIIRRGVVDFAKWSASAVRAIPELAKAGERIMRDLYRRAQDIEEGRKTGQVLSPNEVFAVADAFKSWAGWYREVESTLRTIFGEDTPLFAKFLAATSPNNTVAGNVSMALRAYRQYVSGRPFEGFMDAHLKNLENAVRGESLSGQKVEPFGRAMSGDKDAVAVDRHVASILYGIGTIKPTPLQVRRAIALIRTIAAERGWDSRDLQAALWAGNIVRTGNKPTSYVEYLKKSAASGEAFWSEIAEAIAARRTQGGTAKVPTVQAGGVPKGTGARPRTATTPAAKPSVASPPVQRQPSAQALGITPMPDPMVQAVASTAKLGLNVLRWYSEWMPDTLRRIGGPVARRVADELNQIISRAREHYGQLTPILDQARRSAGRLGGATTWINRIEDHPTPKTGIINVVGAIENTIPVPPRFQAAVDLWRAANLEIGRLAQRASPGFVATGKFQRHINALGMDIIRRGRGELWEAWTEGLAVANGVPINNVRAFMRRWKDRLDAPGADVALLQKINQDFHRQFPKVVTHLNTAVGWEPVLHSNLFDYLENAAQRTAHAVAFREIYTPGGGLLPATRRAVMREIDSSEFANVFDNTMKAVQGFPVDNLSWMNLLAPDTAVGSVARGLNATLGDLFSKLVLTGQMIIQPGETLVGATPQFLGYHNVIQAAARLRQLYPELELNGAVNRVMRDWVWDPNNPYRSASRITANTISKAAGEQLLNELQEGLAAATAHVVAEKIRAGNLTAWDRRMLPETFRSMGFTEAQASAMMRGDVPLLEQFKRKAASWLTSGNKQMAEGSALGASRLFNSVFRFQSYPMMKTNQLRRVSGNWLDAIRSRDPYRIANSSRLMGRFLAGTLAQGAVTAGLATLAYQGVPGVKILFNEAKEDPVDFVKDAFLTTISGPIYLVTRAMEDSGISGIPKEIGRLLWPATIGTEIVDFAQGRGSYKEKSLPDRVGTFIRKRIPGSRAVSTGFAAVGLSDRNVQFEAARTAYYRWLRETHPERFDSSGEKGRNDESADLQFRTLMRSAVDRMNRGDMDGFVSKVSEAAAVRGSTRSVSDSLRGRKILEELKPEEREVLRDRIGPDAYESLENHDAMLDVLAGAMNVKRR